MRVVALIPAHDEAATVAETVHAVLAVGGVTEVIVIDDGSSDATARIAANAGAKVLRTESNLGKGAALDLAASEVDHGSFDAVLLLDADLGSTAAEASTLLEPIASGAADMVIARFPAPAGPAGFGLVKRVARWGIKRWGGEFEANAPLSGQRAIRAEHLGALTPFAFGYGVEVALTVRALRSGMRLQEVPTTMAHAATGRDIAGFIHRGRQFLHVLRALARLSSEA